MRLSQHLPKHACNKIKFSPSTILRSDIHMNLNIINGNVGNVFNMNLKIINDGIGN